MKSAQKEITIREDNDDHWLCSEIWSHINEKLALLRWIDKWKKGEIVYIDIMACGIVKESWICYNKLERDLDIKDYIDDHQHAYPVALNYRITPIPYKAKGYKWELLHTTRGTELFREFII